MGGKAMWGIASSIRGGTRLGSTTAEPVGSYEITPSSETASEATPSWLSEVQKLVPGEALAAYIALQPVAAMAQHPGNVRIVLALVFLFVTIILKWIGTQDPAAADPARTTQRTAVAISAASFISLVYATGGQIFWHPPLADQALYGQIGAAAIGAVGPALFRWIQRLG